MGFKPVGRYSVCIAILMCLGATTTLKAALHLQLTSSPWVMVVKTALYTEKSPLEDYVPPPNNDTEFVIHEAFNETRSESVLGDLPRWVFDECPTVVEHFKKFPYFDKFPASTALGENVPYPIQTTSYAAKTVCLMGLAQKLIEGTGSLFYIQAGSLLGGILHAGPIPWDDDADAYVGLDFKDEFLKTCQGYVIAPNVTLDCKRAGGALKLYAEDGSSTKTAAAWKAPFIDIGVFRVEGESLLDIDTGNTRVLTTYNLADFDEAQQYYYGGLYLPGPRPEVVTKRYRVDVCKISWFNHRLEQKFRGSSSELDCNQLQERLPFVFNTRTPDGREYRIVQVDGVTRMVIETEEGIGDVRTLCPDEFDIFKQNELHFDNHTYDGIVTSS